MLYEEGFMKLFTDEILIKGLHRGEKIYIDHIYYSYNKRIYGFAYSLLKNREESFDVVHEVFIHLWEKRNELREDTKLEALLFTITRNTVLSIFRKKASQQKYITEYLHSNSARYDNSTEEDVAFAFLNERLHSIVLKLPPKRREVFILSREKGLTNKEISNKLNIAEKTVEDHITRALAFFKKNIHSIGN